FLLRCRPPLCSSLFPYTTLFRSLEVREAQRAKVERNRARLDLGQVEDVADEREQIRPRGIDGLRIVDLLRREGGVGVVGEELREDQQAVERRAQLVRHVRQELRLVARAERELLGFLLERRLRQLDLAVLVLDLAHLLREQLRLV